MASRKATHLIHTHKRYPHIATSVDLGIVERYEYVLDLIKDLSIWPFDYGLVAVLDGEILKLTPLRISNIPPPMSASELPLESTPVHVAFDLTGRNFAILRKQYVDIATWLDFNSIKVANVKIVHTFRYRLL